MPFDEPFLVTTQGTLSRYDGRFSLRLIECCGILRHQMVKEQLSIAGSQDVLGYINEAARKTSLCREQAFDDFLAFVRRTPTGRTTEEEYLATVAKAYAKEGRYCCIGSARETVCLE